MRKKRYIRFTDFIGELPQIENQAELASYVYNKEMEYLYIFRKNLGERIKEELGCLVHGKRLRKLPSKDYLKLSRMQKSQYNLALRTLEAALYYGRLDESHLRGNILDFGCGTGGSSILLSLQSDYVTAIDMDGSCLNELRGTNLFPTEEIIEGDGLEYMLSHPGQYDLITAFAFCEIKPQTTQKFTDDFCRIASMAAKPGGRVLVLSDLLTMDKVREAFGSGSEQESPNLFIYEKNIGN